MGVATEPTAQASFLGGRPSDTAAEGEQRVVGGRDERERRKEHHQKSGEQSGGVAGGHGGDRHDGGDEPGQEDDAYRGTVPPSEEHDRQSMPRGAYAGTVL
ncbi:Uncharacterised protein [Rhodococcus gordoniae]|uniref:Uncharacterized protein n=1 Tax=Rhodococcus gordoniae TaxID=223392 RepID=A0A379LXC7_9NOCA|nr:Uncharacterised protein [Rhodococcus gordoniae]